MLPIVPLLIHESVRYGFAMFFARKVCLSVSSERKKSVCVGVLSMTLQGESSVHLCPWCILIWHFCVYGGGEGKGWRRENRGRVDFNGFTVYSMLWVNSFVERERRHFVSNVKLQVD